MELIKQEVSADKWETVPDEVRNLHTHWRLTTLYPARSLEKMLDTPAKIFYKYEGVNPSGFLKSNTAIARAY